MPYLVLDVDQCPFRFNSLSESQLDFLKDKNGDGEAYVFNINTEAQFEIVDECDETSVDNMDFEQSSFYPEYQEWLADQDSDFEYPTSIEDYPETPDDDYNDPER